MHAINSEESIVIILRPMCNCASIQIERSQDIALLPEQGPIDYDPQLFFSYQELLELKDYSYEQRIH